MKAAAGRMRRRGVLGAVLAWLLLSPGAATAVVSTPPGFQERSVSGAFTLPTAFAEAPDGRIFVAEKRGPIKVVRTDGTLAPKTVINLTPRVNSYSDRGVLGLAVDSAFATNGYLYVYYVYEHDATKPTGPKVARVSRFQVRPDNTVAGAETVILGTFVPLPGSTVGCPASNNLIDCIPAEGSSHNGGGLKSDADGTLWLAVGDANFGLSNGDSIRYRPYDETSYAGKLLHFDRAGRGLAGHPFCPTNGDLTQVCSKIYAKGFRNPFRITLRGSGRGPIVGDVGYGLREEIDLVRPGRNYGWPCYEGDVRQPTWQGSATCRDLYAKEGTAAGATAPNWSYAHGTGAAIIAGPQYRGTLFPSWYRSQIYVGDYVQGWIKRLTIDADDRVTAVEDFASGWYGVDLQELRSGELAYLLIAPNLLNAIGYSSDDQRPVARLSADPTYGRLPLTVSFSGAQSTDAEGGALTYAWDFGDGSPGETGQTVSHTYTTRGPFTAELTVTDPAGGVDTEQVQIHAGNTPPEVTVSAPADRSTYRDGVAVPLRGSATDADDGAMTGSALRWEIVLQHGLHQHPLSAASGAESQFTPLTEHDADSHYLITLTATDSGGLSASRTVRIDPETVQITLTSNPPGALISYDGVERVAPFVTRAAIGFRAPVNAADTLTVDGASWVFRSWSDGGAQGHTIVIPASDATYTATYAKDTVRPETTITKAPPAYTTAKRSTFEFTASEPVKNFFCKFDNGYWSTCTSPLQTKEMTGTHTFYVRAVDRAGNYDLSPASHKWTILG